MTLLEHSTPEQDHPAPEKPQKLYLPLTIMVIGLLATILMLGSLLSHIGGSTTSVQVDAAIMDKYDQFVTNHVLAALGDKNDVERTYWLNDSDMVAPEPNQALFGQAKDPAELESILQDAAWILDGQKTLFTTQTPVKPGSTIHYYLDDTIFAVTWKQSVRNCTYTFSEVRIAHPSQFRRFLSNGQYGSGVLHTTSEMATSVNAVVASSGDYYSYRNGCVVINNGVVHNTKDIKTMDICYIDEEGDLLFTRRGELASEEELKQFAADNHVRFSLCFGPIMLEDGKICVPLQYNLGEINDFYPRAVLGQLDKLHYVLVTANMEDPDYGKPTVSIFAEELLNLGIPTAYALDGGQTATIVMNDQVINTVSYSSEREISDIIYFATAIPSQQSE